MIDYKTLLERMASISPGVQLHLGGQLWVENVDADELTPQILVNECFALMVQEAYELGLEFYCPLGDLCESFYLLDKVLLLFEAVFPTPFYRSLTEDNFFKAWTQATLIDGAGEPGVSGIEALLFYLAFEHPEAGDVFVETYDFLHDKLRSTPVFDTYVTTLLEADNTPYSAITDEAVIAGYLQALQAKLSRLRKAVDVLQRFDPAFAAEIQERRILVYQTNASAADRLAVQAWAWQLHDQALPTPQEQVLALRINQDFEAITPFFIAYYQQHADLTAADIASLLLGALDGATTRQAFLAKVERVSRAFDALSADRHLWVQRASLALIEEFFA